jgi:integrase
MGKKLKLNKKTLDSLKPPTDVDRVRYYDSEVSGFGVTVYASGRKSFFLNYGPERHRRRIKLGDYGPLTPDTAKAMARKLTGDIVSGDDPLEERKAVRTMPTFSKWVETYMVEVERRKKHPRNDKHYLAMATERWGTKALDEVTVTDVRKLFESITAGGHKINANRWLASVRTCLQAAWREDYIESNPAMKVKPNRESEPRDRVLSDDEFKRLLKAIPKVEDPHVRAAFTLLIETGARVSEVLHARWEDFDLDGRIWRIPSTKAGKPQVLPLAPSTVAVLDNLDHPDDYVIAGRFEKKPRADLKKPWAELLKAAELTDVHIHDIRRTFGLHVARRAGIHVASRLLRHSDIRVTERHYAPLGLDDLRKALDARTAEVVKMKRRR